VIAGGLTPEARWWVFPIGAVALKGRRRTAQVIAYVVAWALFAFQRLILWEIPFMAGPFRLVPGRSIAAVSVPGRSAGDGDREARELGWFKLLKIRYFILVSADLRRAMFLDCRETALLVEWVPWKSRTSLPGCASIRRLEGAGCEPCCSVRLARRGDARPDSDIDILGRIAPDVRMDVFQICRDRPQHRRPVSGASGCFQRIALKPHVKPIAEREAIYAF